MLREVLGSKPATAIERAPLCACAEACSAALNAVKINIGFTAVYNPTGLSLAAFSLLPPTIAAAARAGPDFGMLTNSARLLRQCRGPRSAGSGSGTIAPRTQEGALSTALVRPAVVGS